MSLAYCKWCLLGLVGVARIFIQPSMLAIALVPLVMDVLVLVPIWVRFDQKDRHVLRI